jgi:uncharacterized protein (DUF2132 family)
MTSDLTILLVASRKGWYDYIVPYIFYSRITNPDSRVEVIVDDLAYVEETYGEELSWANKTFPDQFLIRENTKKINDSHFRLIRNALRFLEEPTIKSKYTYIGDIDILLTESIPAYHIDKMEADGIPFSNQIKRDNGYPMLTGLHFYKTDEYEKVYNRLDEYYNRLPIFRCDQQLLFHMMEENFNVDFLKLRPKRPIHGIHMSRSRQDPLAENFGWNINKGTVAGYQYIKEHELWEEFYGVISKEYRDKLVGLEKYIDEFQGN